MITPLQADIATYSTMAAITAITLLALGYSNIDDSAIPLWQCEGCGRCFPAGGDGMKPGLFSRKFIAYTSKCEECR